MKNRRRLLSSITVATVFLSASPASAQESIPAYNTTLYSDATYTTVVGSIVWTGCDAYNNPTYRLDGQNTNYAVDHHAGYCYGGGREPL